MLKTEVPLAHWDHTLRDAGCDDVYLSAGYHRASAVLETGGAEPLLLSLTPDTSATYLMPLLVRGIPGSPYSDATSAYGYGGPWVTGDPDLDQVRAEFDSWAAERGVVATLLRSNPALSNESWFPSGSTVVPAGRTVEWATPPGRDLLAAMKKSHRWTARHSIRSGLTVRVIVGPEDLTDFSRLYKATMTRVEAADFYFFPDEYWNLIARELHDRLVLVQGELDGEIVAAALCLLSGEWLHYHLSATSDRGRELGATARCLLDAALWAQARGIRRFHLGGGVGGSDSGLRAFKRRFDPDGPEHPFSVGKLVHLPDVYRELTGGDSVEGYFPPWRR